MIKVIKVNSRHLVLYTGTQDEIDKDIFRLLDWYAEQYGIDVMYDMLLAHSRKLITEAKETNSCTKQ